jgi:hypothetical protein
MKKTIEWILGIVALIVFWRAEAKIRKIKRREKEWKERRNANKGDLG